MNEDIDDVAFLTGSPQESGFLMNKRVMYEPGSVMVCSQKNACCIISFGFIAIISSALIVSFIKQGCPEATYTGEPSNRFPGFKIDHTTPPPISTSGEKYPWADIRLPLYIQPLHYTLNLHPNFNTSFVEGNVTIMLTAVEETRYIVMHGSELNVTQYYLEDKYKQRIQIDKFLMFPHFQQLYFGLSKILHRGSNYSLTLVFNSFFRESLDGFYLSSYTADDGNLRFIAATHFEPTFARTSFPCFDEPHMKARFKFSVVRENSQFALFNMPLKKSTNLTDTLVVDEFEETVEMSTYLVAFIICDFVSITNSTKHNVEVSVYTPSNMINQADYALRTALLLMDFYEEFFRVAYPLPKQDLIAIPNFAAGAMENWGLITYRETSLMYDPIHTSAFAQQRVAMVIAHELAHQWFGNLVTMSWWNDLWLNEGFASFMENIGTEVAEPGWAMPEQFIIEKVQPALSVDSLIASHPISVPVRDPASIESIFDTISYKKGASVINMLKSCVGLPVLQEGLREYLNTHRYSTADMHDLWESISKADQDTSMPINVKTMMDTWIREAGYPLISVKIGEVKVTVNQMRFLEYKGNLSKVNSGFDSTQNVVWQVPLSYISSSNPRNPSTVWMNDSYAQSFLFVSYSA